MQLGTRWAYGSGEQPATLPEVVTMAIQTVESDDSLAQDATPDWRWTLTWLEGKPVVELDDGTVIRYDAAEDAATITLPAETTDDDEDW
ncbi:hypothetical protein WDJ51_04740 [Rathayibacter sp. YIM 133350]|uniref:hypothetical protein n=1 Tax=Rathayibacter sp. YIM 133350 TaxID=3131992 RepID=UPI00307F9A76